jgi:hypothetical protein
LSASYETFEFDIREDSDISISGLAFIRVGAGAKLSVRVPKGIDVTSRPTIFKGGV